MEKAVSERSKKVGRVDVDLMRQGVLLHDAQIAVLLDMLAADNIISPGKYHENLRKLIEFRNKQYGGERAKGHMANG